ncbi:glycoside hydrolase [Pseudomaricurvus alcaniphilus]|uniref:glycoside hydrolase n=1 Tax=Pseudomaricurvus alcaniphilus TaxID=1166482 RepID=UPI001409845B|nr:glycoside hydrolase [Pseudomaricurvus alcaniphilus]NHN36943.1 glycoside hydrolase [Pseudomaricurvus alcaniphilus]
MRLNHLLDSLLLRQHPTAGGATLAAASAAVQLRLLDRQPLHQVDPRYLSFSIDISVLAGGFWWEGSGNSRRGLGTLRVPPLDLNSKKLDRLVQALAPAYLRVGGSEADKIHYFASPGHDASELILTQTMWDSLHSFITRNQCKFAFTYKYGLFKRRQHGEWAGTEIQQLLEYSSAQGYRLDVCELGNELNAYWAFHGIRSQPRAKMLARDYATFARLLRRYYPDVKICGPGSAFWPRLGETIRPFSNITPKFLQTMGAELDIVDWHYYPFQSERSPLQTRSATLQTALSIKSFDTFGHYSEKLRHWRDLYQPQAELWTGETGSAQCGGQPRISDRFASCFWWADQLGQGALLGQKVMVRQSLIGGDYGMINRLTLKPRPDYWVSWLWGQLMGEAVYGVSNSHPDLRVYCHQHKHSSDLVLLIINTSCALVSIDLQSFGRPAMWGGADRGGASSASTVQVQQSYSLYANKLTAKRVFINGVRPRLHKGQLGLQDFPQQAGSNPLRARSINFWRIR